MNFSGNPFPDTIQWMLYGHLDFWNMKITTTSVFVFTFFFTDMMQMNLSTHKQRKVRRRPKFTSVNNRCCSYNVDKNTNWLFSNIIVENVVKSIKTTSQLPVVIIFCVCVQSEHFWTIYIHHDSISISYTFCESIHCGYLAVYGWWRHLDRVSETSEWGSS